MVFPPLPSPPPSIILLRYWPSGRGRGCPFFYQPPFSLSSDCRLSPVFAHAHLIHPPHPPLFLIESSRTFLVCIDPPVRFPILRVPCPPPPHAYITLVPPIYVCPRHICMPSPPLSHAGIRLPPPLLNLSLFPRLTCLYIVPPPPHHHRLSPSPRSFPFMCQ